MANQCVKMELCQKANSAIKELDEAVYGVLNLLKYPMHPGGISKALNVPRSLDPDIPYQTIRDSLFRLLDQRKVKRVTDPDSPGRQKWQAIQT